jgi:hypothetical protein
MKTRTLLMITVLCILLFGVGIPGNTQAAPIPIDTLLQFQPEPVPNGGVFIGDPLLVPTVSITPDAKYTWGWVTGTVYYNRGETRSLKTVSFAGFVAAGLCAAFGWETAGAACVISGALIAQWNYVAGNAYANGHCVKIKIPSFWAFEYSGGYCT